MIGVYKCHPDNPKHIGATCQKPCAKLHPICHHPCQKLCKENCGKCDFLVGDIILPGCKHVWHNANCQQDRMKNTLKCMTIVKRQHLHCEHTIVMNVSKLFLNTNYFYHYNNFV